MSDLSTYESRMCLATENVNRDTRANQIEQEARAIARYYGTDEEQWKQYIPLLIAVEEGRLKSVWLERQTPEWQEGFAEYMRNR